MKSLYFLVAIFLSASITFAHCGNCEKGKDGQICSKHKTEMAGKADTSSMACDSLTCPKMKGGKACDRADCPKHKSGAADSSKAKGHCPKSQKH